MRCGAGAARSDPQTRGLHQPQLGFAASSPPPPLPTAAASLCPRRSPTGRCPCPCNYAADPGCACRDLRQRISVAASKTPTYASYPLTYRQDFGVPYEVPSLPLLMLPAVLLGRGLGWLQVLRHAGRPPASLLALAPPPLKRLVCSAPPAPPRPAAPPQRAITVEAPSLLGGAGCRAGEFDARPTCGWTKDPYTGADIP